MSVKYISPDRLSDTSTKVAHDEIITGQVVHINDITTLVIDKGEKHGVRCGQRYLVYQVGKEIYSPTTNESLGKLEIVCGTGRVIHVQENMATIEADKIISSGGLLTKETHEIVPFKNVEVGRLIRRIE